MVFASDQGKDGGRIDATKQVVTRTADTVSAYRTTYASLVRVAETLDPNVDLLAGMVAWFADQHERWSPATIRVYAAALHQTVDLAMSAGDLGGDEGNAMWVRLDTDRPRPRLTGPKRTSARKRRSCPLEEIRKVRAVLLGEGQLPGHPDDVVVAQLLFHNSLLGLRPCEWARAQVEGTHLIVQNAKATNGRACGTERTIELLGPYADPVVRANLVALIAAMRCRPTTSIAGKRSMGQLSARLDRACQRAKIGRISLYTLRHVALASAKRVMTTAEVAAFAGHAVDRTAGQHYAKRRSGWRLKQGPGRPSPDTVARVRITGKAQRPERITGPSL